MAKGSRNNGFGAFGRSNGFLSNLVSGEVKQITPDGCMYDTGLGPYERMDDPPVRTYGARSGTGKETVVNTGTARTKLRGAS